MILIILSMKCLCNMPHGPDISVCLPILEQKQHLWHWCLVSHQSMPFGSCGTLVSIVFRNCPQGTALVPSGVNEVLVCRRFLTVLYRCWFFCIKSIAGVRMVGLSGSIDTGMSGFAFITAITSAIKVLGTSCVSCDGLLRSIASKIHLTTLMNLSQDLPV